MTTTSAGPPPRSGPGFLLELVRTARARTRRELQEVTGLSRSTITSRVDQLIAAGYLHESGVTHGSRGRPSTVLAFNEDCGVVLTADLGAKHARVAVCDLGGHVLAEHTQGLRIDEGPESVLNWLDNRWRRLLDTSDLRESRVVGICSGIPGPVDAVTGRPVRPPIMPGWDDYPVRERLGQAFGAPAFVENDANIMALGEYHANPSWCPSLLFVKVATGIGAGVVINGQLLRGVHGGSGDIGHVRVSDPDSGPVCACGARGCLAASASGGAIARQLREQNRTAPTSRVALQLAQDGDPDAVALVRHAGLLLGDVLATAVSLLNPRVLMIGGDVLLAQEHFMAAVRERIYQRTQQVATRDLQIVPSSLGDRAGVVGAARLVVEEVFAPNAVDSRFRA